VCWKTTLQKQFAQIVGHILKKQILPELWGIFSCIVFSPDVFSISETTVFFFFLICRQSGQQWTPPAFKKRQVKLTNKYNNKGV